MSANPPVWFRKLGHRVAARLYKFKAVERFFERRVAILTNTDPTRIKAEDVAQFFCLPKMIARSLLGLCVREGTMAKNADGTYKMTRSGHRRAEDIIRERQPLEGHLLVPQKGE